jgi:hypothetical protein
MTQTPLGNQLMNQGLMQVRNLSTIESTHNHFKTQVQVRNIHDKGERGLNNQVGVMILQVGFVT